MKIGFFTDWYVPEKSGLDSSIETFKKDFEKLGHEVYIFAPSYKGCKDDDPRVLRFKSLKILEKPETRLAYPVAPIASFKKMKRTNLDIVHAHTPFSMGVLGKYLAFVKKIPFLYTHHTDYQEYSKVYFKEKLILPFFANALTSWFSNISDAVIAPSFKIKKFLKEKAVKKKIYVIPTGIDTNLFKESLEEKEKIRKKLKIPKKSFVLLFVGRMGMEKNIEFLLRAFKKLPRKKDSETIFVLVGDGPHLDKFKDLAKEMGIFHFLRFAGAVPRKEIPHYYQAADIFIFSSLTETQGIVVFEAIASGLPIVALEDDIYKNVVINEKNGFLIAGKEKNKEKAFSQKITRLIDDPSLRKKFSFISRQTACRFSREKQAEKLLAVYQKEIKEKIKNY